MKKILIAFGFSVFFLVGVEASPGAKLRFGTEYFPPSKIDDVPAGSPSKNIEISYSKNYAQFAFPILIFNQGRTILVNSLYAEILPINYDNVVTTPTSNSLGGFDATFTWVQNWTPQWRTAAFLKPGYYSDFERSTGNSFRLQGGGIISRVFSRAFEIGLGALYINDFGEPDVSPAFVVKYQTRGPGPPQVGDNIIDINIPKHAAYWRVIRRPLHLGLAAHLSGGHYRITKKGPFDNDSVKFSVGTIGPGLRLIPSKHFILEIQGGVTFRRAFEIRSGDTTVVDFDLEQSGFGRLVLLICM